MSSPALSTAQGQPADAELHVLTAISSLLIDLPSNSQVRIVNWISSRFGAQEVLVASSKQRGGMQPADSSREFPDVATLFIAAKPSTGPEKALILGYWLQECLRREEWEGFAVNSELKHLGHGLKNVTDALKALIDQRPQLVVQLRKSGKTKQARKRYRLTIEGIRKARLMVSSGNEA